ncbi:MAG TPA: D-alanine--D-alanine ligase, partial [Candidatus Bathyarchaeia archaeon]|nr:D-alanine--D-alanine ligase [Candidatus Bathyarchaeia archaeon]
MRIGLTYDLRAEYLAMGYGEEETAEFAREETIDELENAIRRLAHEPDRIGSARRLVERLARGERWDLVFNIAEGLRGVGREAQVPAILDLYEIPYTFSDPLVMALTLHKGMTKRVVRDAGLPTPQFALVEHAAGARRVAFEPP